jgi:hypothetical protein
MINPQILAAGVVFVAGVTAGATVQGWRLNAEIGAIKAAYAEAAEQARAETRKVEALRDAAIDQAETIAALENREAETIERVITETVIEYVQGDNAGNVCVSNEWVRIHDAAASGRMPETEGTASAPNDAAAGITNAQTLSVVSGNYVTCRAIRRQLGQLQAWARASVTQ